MPAETSTVPCIAEESRVWIIYDRYSRRGVEILSLETARHVRPQTLNWHSLHLIAIAMVSVLIPSLARADQFQEQIEPFAKKYCHSCHNKKQSRGELDLTRYTRDRDVTSRFSPLE